MSVARVCLGVVAPSGDPLADLVGPPSGVQKYEVDLNLCLNHIRHLVDAFQFEAHQAPLNEMLAGGGEVALCGVGPLGVLVRYGNVRAAERFAVKMEAAWRR